MRPAPAVLRSDNLIDAYELDADLDAMSGTTAEEEYTDALRAEIAYRPERDGTLVIETDAAGTHGPSMGPSPADVGVGSPVGGDGSRAVRSARTPRRGGA